MTTLLPSPRRCRGAAPSWLAVIAVFAVLGGAGTAPVHAQSDDQQGLVELGELEEPEKLAPTEVMDGKSVVAVTEDPPRLFYSYAWNNEATDGFTRFVREYDASTPVPKFTGREIAIGTTTDLGTRSSPVVTTVDTTRNRLLLMSLAGDRAYVVVVDLDDFKVVEQWDLTTSVPGLFGKGITYDPDHDRVYVVGSLLGLVDVGNTTPVVVAAFDPEGGTAIWNRPVPECHKLADVYQTGTLIASSAHRPELSFFCRHQGAVGMSGDMESRSSPSGLVQLGIDPGAGPVDAARFPVEFHRVAGIYTSGTGGAGIAAFDRESDRFFVQSLSPKAPGTWIFDGDANTWTGFLAARPPEFGNAERNGFSPFTGHYYMIADPGECGDPPTGECGYVQVTDGRTTPIPQGERVDMDVQSYIVADPASSRLFAQTPDRGWIVLSDEIAAIDVLEPVEYDEDTDDVPESEDTSTFYSGTSRGFGVRARLVGGVEAAITLPAQETARGVLANLCGLNAPGGEPLLPCDDLGIGPDRGQTSSGTRIVTAAELTSAALGVAGSTATAQSATLGDGTAGDLDALQRELGAEDVALWPYTPVNCSDGRSAPEEAAEEDPLSAGSSRVACDLEAEETTASTSFGQFGPGDVVSVASSGVDTRLVRVGVDDPLDANVVAVETVATAKGVEVGTPDDAESPGGSVSIGEVRSVARITAGGRTGTAAARWVRILQDVVVRDAEDEVVAGPASCVTVVDAEGGEEVDDCAAIVDAANQVLHTTMRLQLPMAAVTATPRGAFAEVRQQDPDHLRDSALRDEEDLHVPGLDLVLFNDGAETSRMVVELAALQADAIYQITDFGFGGTSPEPEPTDRPTDDGSSEIAGDDDSSDAGATSTGTTSMSSGSDSQGAAVQPTVPQGEAFDFASAPQAEQPEIAPRQSGVPSVGQMGSGLQLLARDPAQAALVGGVWLLFAGALTTLLRRIQLRQLATT